MGNTNQRILNSCYTKFSIKWIKSGSSLHWSSYCNLYDRALKYYCSTFIKQPSGTLMMWLAVAISLFQGILSLTKYLQGFCRKLPAWRCLNAKLFLIGISQGQQMNSKWQKSIISLRIHFLLSLYLLISHTFKLHRIKWKLESKW